MDQLDGVFVLEIDLATLARRLDSRPSTEWGSQREEHELIEHLHATREGTPVGATLIDATASLTEVVDTILSEVQKAG